ncbi:MAG TPA: glucosaminidase domain-containing protein [Polyangiaceae bacterium]|nr:glucosaminidase domain-containing protein [Polyangiaceae bacterium]
MASAIQSVTLNPAQKPVALATRVNADPAFETLLAARTQAVATPALVAPTRTRLDGAQAAEALRSAWTRVTGQPPSQKTVAVLTAQWAHETGNGASMYNYNFGGIKGASPDGLSVSQRTHEGYGSSERTIMDRFRAYKTADDGATDYVKLLVNRFPEATQSATQGDPVGFVKGLKQRGYFTGDPAAYTHSVASLTAQGLEQGFSAVGSHLGELGAPPALNLHATPLGSPDYALANYVPDTTGPLVDALRIGDELSRAALRIVGSTSERKDG